MTAYTPLYTQNNNCTHNVSPPNAFRLPQRCAMHNSMTVCISPSLHITFMCTYICTCVCLLWFHADWFIDGGTQRYMCKCMIKIIVLFWHWEITHSRIFSYRELILKSCILSVANYWFFYVYSFNISSAWLWFPAMHLGGLLTHNTELLGFDLITHRKIVFEQVFALIHTLLSR